MIKKYKSILLASVLGLLLGHISAFSQQRTVSGTVKDETGIPVPGVNIVLKGTSNGTISNADGAFTINANQGDVLVVSFIGFKTQEVTVDTRTTFDIELTIDTETLEEIVIVGYGETKKKLVTGANVQVGGETLQDQNRLNPLQALQGQAAGVVISSTSGQPGSDMKVIIRGLGTTGSSSPLYVIDGVPGGDITILNPADIKSIDVLKDAASAAIYGAQSSNGVVLVTTKSGTKGKGQVTFDAFTGVQNVNRKADLLNADEYKVIMNEQALNSGSAPIDFSTFNELANTNWMDYMFKENAKTSNYSLGINGGSETSTYSISLNYIDQEGIVGGKAVSNYKRYGFRTNTEHKLYGEVLKVGQHLNFNYIQNVGINVGNQYNNTLRGAFGTSPLSPVYSNNNLFDSPFNDTQNSDWYNGDGNPYGSMMTSVNNQNNAQRLLADMYAELQPIKGLRLKSLLGINYYSSDYRAFTPLYQFSIYSYSTDHTTTSQSMSKGAAITWFNTATYDFTILEEHTMSAMVGMESYQDQGSYLNGSNWNLLSQFNDFSHAFLSNTTGQAYIDDEGNVVETRTVSGANNNKYRRASYFGRLSYNFREKYLFNATVRRDGSSNFARGNRWGVFPSLSAGWIVTQDFLQSVTVLDFLKFRVSWGQVGNQNASPFQFAAPINTSTNLNSNNPGGFYTFGTNNLNIPGAYPIRLSNPGLGWETSEQTNIGFDSKLLRNRLTATVDFYIKNNKNWLITAPILATAGALPPVINGGGVKNTGIELALDWSDNIGDITYRIGVNGTYNKNTVSEIPTEDGIIHGYTNMLYDNAEEFYRAQNGHALGYFWGYQTAGIFQSEQDIINWQEAGNGILQNNVKPGDVKFVDRVKDGVINNQDKTAIGNGLPDVTFGFNVSVGYKGFDLSVNAYGAAGHQIVQSYRNHSNKYSNYTSSVLSRWTGEGTSNRMPRVTETNINWQFSDLYLQDGDYLRIANITLGYDLAKLVNKGFLGQMRVYVQGQNLFTFTKYDGMDPEIGYGTEGWVSGVDLGYYPRPKVVLAGVNIKF